MGFAGGSFDDQKNKIKIYRHHKFNDTIFQVLSFIAPTCLLTDLIY